MADSTERNSGDNSTQNLMKQGMFLTVATIVVRVIGVFYRVPLANLWGDNGNGTYGDAYQVYSLLLLISSVCVPTMMSKLMGDRIALGKNHEAKMVFRCCMILFTGLGFLGFLCMFFGNRFIADYFFHNPDLALSIRGLSPAVLIVSSFSVFRGYFQGLNNMKPSAASQVLEGAVHAIFSIILAYLLYPKGLAWSVFGGILATGIASALCFVFLWLCYRMYNKRSRFGQARASESEESAKEVYQAIILMSLPIILSNVIYNLKGIVDSVVFTNLMLKIGCEAEDITSMRGIYSGKFSVFLYVPIAVGDAVSTAIVPNIARDCALRDFKGIRTKVRQVSSLVLLLTIPASIGLAVFGKPIVHLFFPASPLGGELFWFGAFAAAFYSISDISTGVLQGLGKQHIPMWNSLFAALASIILNVFMVLVLKLSIYTLPISMLLFSLFRMLLNYRAVKRYCKIKESIFKQFVHPMIGAACMAVACILFYVLVYTVFGSNWIALFAGIGVGILVYFFIMVNFGWISEEDQENIPYGRYLSYFRL